MSCLASSRSTRSALRSMVVWLKSLNFSLTCRLLILVLVGLVSGSDFFRDFASSSSPRLDPS